MADVVAYTSIAFGKPSKITVGDQRPNLLRWFESVSARPSAAA